MGYLKNIEVEKVFDIFSSSVIIRDGIVFSKV